MLSQDAVGGIVSQRGHQLLPHERQGVILPRPKHQRGKGGHIAVVEQVVFQSFLPVARPEYHLEILFRVGLAAHGAVQLQAAVDGKGAAGRIEIGQVGIDLPILVIVDIDAVAAENIAVIRRQAEDREGVSLVDDIAQRDHVAGQATLLHADRP